MKNLYLFLLIFCQIIFFADSANMIFEGINGTVTKKEIDAFKAFMKTQTLPTDNIGNKMVYGRQGIMVETMGFMYEISKDQEILDHMITFADHMLHGRNDEKNGRTIWTGNKELVWPNKVDSNYSGTENGDILGHIAYTAKLILESKDLWPKSVSDGDKFKYGATYKERALHYIKESDRTIDTFMTKWFIHSDTHQQWFPNDPLYGTLEHHGSVVPWNQQMMINNGYQRLAECHQILGDDNNRVERYDQIVNTSIHWFISSMEPVQVNGHLTYKWTYALEHPMKHFEDIGHGMYDIMGIYRAYLSNRYKLSRNDMLPFANTLAYVIQTSDGVFATRVDGMTGKGHMHGFWISLVEFMPQLFQKIADYEKSRIATEPETTALLLWVKHRLNSR